MKKLTLFLTFALIASYGFSQISTTAHDLSTYAFTDEICIVCHTPHNAGSTDAPLWDRTATSATFTVYSSNTIDANSGTIPAPSNESKLCLSCHDGTVELEAFGSSTATTSTYITTTNGDLLGTDLRDDHPVSMTYNSALITDDPGLVDPTTAGSGITGTIEEDMLFGTAGSKTVECASCHDVHDNTNGKFLLISNSGSALCLKCHDK